MRMMRMRTHQGGAFKRVRARGGRERSVLLKYEIQKQNTQTRLTPPSKTIPSGAPFLRIDPGGSFLLQLLNFRVRAFLKNVVTSNGIRTL